MKFYFSSSEVATVRGIRESAPARTMRSFGEAKILSIIAEFILIALLNRGKIALRGSIATTST